MFRFEKPTFRNTGNRLQMLCNQLHKFEIVSSQVMTLEI